MHYDISKLSLKEKIGQLEQAAAMMAQYANQQGATDTTTTDTTTTGTTQNNDQDVVDVDYSEK